MVLKLGGEYELKDLEVKTSKLEARELFLELIWEMKPEVAIDLIRLFNLNSVPSEWQNSVEHIDFCTRLFLFHTQNHQFYSFDFTSLGFKPDVRNTPFLAYFDFIFRNELELNNLIEKIERNGKHSSGKSERYLIVSSALEELIPSWNSLKLRDDSEWLCKTLIEGSEKWNLTDDWCLDFALECLKNCKINLIDRNPMPENYLSINSYGLLREYENFWHSGSAWNSSLGKQIWKNQNNYVITDKISNYPTFEFVWRSEEDSSPIFKVTGTYYPLNPLEEKFRPQLEEDFWNKFFDYFKYKQHLLIGNSKWVLNNFDRFQLELDSYIVKVKKKIKPFVIRAARKRDGDKHFRWLIEYQIPPVKSYNFLSQKILVDRRAIMDGIKNVSELLCLTLRSSSKRGKIKGAKDLRSRQERRKSNI